MPRLKPLPRMTRPGLDAGPDRAVGVLGDVLALRSGRTGRSLPVTPSLGKVMSAVLTTTRRWSSGAGGVVADDDAGGAQRGDVGDDRLERGHPQAPLAGRLDAELAAEQAEHVDGEVEGADDADQVDGDAAALLGGARPGASSWSALPPKARLARSTPTAMVSTTMPSAKPKSASPMLGPCRVSGPRAIGPPVVAEPGAEASMVKVWVWPAALVAIPAAAVPLRDPAGLEGEGHQAGQEQTGGVGRGRVLEEVAVGHRGGGVGATRDQQRGADDDRAGCCCRGAGRGEVAEGAADEERRASRRSRSRTC